MSTTKSTVSPAQQLANIANAMLSTAPAIPEVMARLRTFIGQNHLVAHNAGFDRTFITTPLLGGLDPFGHDFSAEVLAKRHDGSPQPLHAAVAAEPGDERAIHGHHAVARQPGQRGPGGLHPERVSVFTGGNAAAAFDKVRRAKFV